MALTSSTSLQNNQAMYSYLMQQKLETERFVGKTLEDEDDSHSVATTSTVVETVVKLPDKVHNDIKLCVNTWLSIDNQIEHYLKMIKELRSKKQQLSNQIQQFMKQNEIDNINTKKGKIKYRVSKSKPPLKIKEVKEKLINTDLNSIVDIREFWKTLANEKTPIEKHTLRLLKIK